MLNLVVNKLTPAPHPKSRAAFIREYENSVATLKYTPDTATKDWFASLIKLQMEQEKSHKVDKPKIRMSPKKKIPRSTKRSHSDSAAPSQKSAKSSA